MFDINKYYDLKNMEFKGDKEDFTDELKNVVIDNAGNCKPYIRYSCNNANTVKITLDNKSRPFKIYGRNNKKIIKEIKKLGKRLKGIKNATDRYPSLIDHINEAIKELDKVKDNEDLLKSKLGQIRNLCSEGIHDEDNLYGEILRRIRRKANSYYVIMYRTGEYIHSTNTIILYLRNIFTHNSEKDNVDDLLSTLLHETVHLIHFECLDLFKIKIKDNIKHEIILESIASFMEHRYLEHKLNNDKLANRLYKSWEDYDMDEYPYAGALYLHGGHDKYFRYINVRHLLPPAITVFNDSLIDMDIAYEDIIMFKRLYEINEGYGRVIF